jgi:hypothetical protein
MIGLFESSMRSILVPCRHGQDMPAPPTRTIVQHECAVEPKERSDVQKQKVSYECPDRDVSHSRS